MKLSVIILAKNEEELIGKCLDSVASLADEVLVINDGSTDETVKIAKQKDARVIAHQKTSFAEARNFAKEQAQNEWLLYIDADEQVTPELTEEILNVMDSDQPHGAYTVVRKNYYLGTLWPKQEKLERLFQKSALKKWVGEVHESAEVSGSIGHLLSHINHDTHRNLAEMVENTIVWSEIEARLRLTAHHPPVVWWRIPRVMLPVFWDYFVKQGGWKVGTIGLIESIYQAFSMFITYARLWEMSSEAGSRSARQ